MAHQQIVTNGIRLHVVQDGQQDSPLVILLHGFPEFWYGWRYQIPYLASVGYRVWAPDQRGYNLSDKPDGIAAYNLDVLAADILGLMDAAGREKASLVGHDWGAAVAWWIAANDDFALYRQAWSQPKAYTPMLNWYRAAVRNPPAPPVSSQITVPTLLIWGTKDRFLGREMAQSSIEHCEDGHLVIIEDATHWVQHEEFEQVNTLMDTFLRGNG